MYPRMKSSAFYDTYHGHDIAHLEYVLEMIKSTKGRSHSIVYLIGDSTLDNKYWFSETARATNGYQRILEPPTSKQDIAFHLNSEIVKHELSGSYTALNCAVEESTVGGRTFGLLGQDKFVANNFTENDVIVVSMGGNDIALRPSLCTILNAAMLLSCTTTSCLENCSCGCSLPCSEYCCGCTTACLSNVLAWPCGYGYFLHLFGTRLKNIVLRILANRPVKPKKVVCCMLYYLDKKPGGSWAEPALAALGYNRNPGHLQAVLKNLFRDATSKISIPGTEVIAVPLFKALDGEDTTDYCARVEPSAAGGAKMAQLLMDSILGADMTVSAMADNLKGPLLAEEIGFKDR